MPNSTPFMWVETLVDCPGAQGLFTYRLPAGLPVQPGDILSVPFGTQQVGAIAVRCVDQPPSGLDVAQVRPVESIVSSGFFPPAYWQLLNQVAEYYCTPLMQVIRVALPPGLLGRSQRRVRLISRGQGSGSRGQDPAQEEDTETRRHGDTETTQSSIFDLQSSIQSPHPPLPTLHSPPPTPLSPAAQQLLQLLQSSKTGDYSWQYLQRQVIGAHRGLQELLTAGWAENYLEPPAPIRPKWRQSVTLTTQAPLTTPLSLRQQEVLTVLKRQGGEMWLADLLQRCQTSSSTLKALSQKGYLIIQPQEVLRAEQGNTVVSDCSKTLTPDQSHALAQIAALSGTVRVLLHGVTGSGKTEVYLQAIAPVLQRGQSALVLVPEIGLTPQLTDRFRSRFGTQVCVYHSALSDGERYDTWRQMLAGEAQVVIGTRSAIFAPLPHLGLIILDEEHDSSFKQDQPAPCYHARTVAEWRTELEQCPLVLGSATPSLESWIVCQGSGVRGQGSGNQNQGTENTSNEAMDRGIGELKESIRIGEHGYKKTLDNLQSTIHNLQSPHLPTLYLSLPTRIHARPLPTIEVVDLRQELRQGNRSIFSRSLQAALHNLQDTGQQGILFIHRRGHSTFVSCRSCGYVMTCPHCDVSLAYHHPHANAHPLLRCHYCHHTQLQPDVCPTCHSGYFKHFGSGTQRVAQELAQHFPNLRVLRFDSDTTRTKGSHRSLLTQFANGEADLLVGTQMLTKGIDLPDVTLVGVVAADGLLHLSDYRASERTFQTLTQVAGRCGRGDRPGRVILQTYSPEHPVIQAVQQQNYPVFVQAELQQRQSLNYPPYGRLILLRFSSTNPVAVQTAAERVAEVLAPLRSLGAEQLGPAPAAILRIANRYRWQILLKLPPGAIASPQIPNLSELRALCPSTVSLTIDVDPLTIG